MELCRHNKELCICCAMEDVLIAKEIRSWEQKFKVAELVRIKPKRRWEDAESC